MAKKILLSLISIALFFTTFSQRSNIKYVIFIGIDGLGAYAIDTSRLPTFKMLMTNGVFSLKAQSCMPSSSAPNWASHFMGVAPEKHGYTRWNSRKPDFTSPSLNEYGFFPTIFCAIKSQARKSTIASVYQWEGIRFLHEKECVDIQQKGIDDGNTVAKAIQVIKDAKPNFLFIHLNGPDSAGHTVGFNSAEFHQKVSNADDHLQQIIAATKIAGIFDQTVFLISSDHGGKNKEHGNDTPIEREVPWMLYGKPLKKTGKIKGAVSVTDTAPTIAWLLNVKPNKAWTGKAIRSGF